MGLHREGAAQESHGAGTHRLVHLYVVALLKVELLNELYALHVVTNSRLGILGNLEGSNFVEETLWSKGPRNPRFQYRIVITLRLSLSSVPLGLPLWASLSALSVLVIHTYLGSPVGFRFVNPNDMPCRLRRPTFSL